MKVKREVGNRGVTTGDRDMNVGEGRSSVETEEGPFDEGEAAGCARHQVASRKEIAAPKPAALTHTPTPNASDGKRDDRAGAKRVGKFPVPESTAHREHVHAVGDLESLHLRRTIIPVELVMGKVEEPALPALPYTDPAGVIPGVLEWPRVPMRSRSNVGLSGLGNRDP
jgi:hypothetical protein